MGVVIGLIWVGVCCCGVVVGVLLEFVGSYVVVVVGVGFCFVCLFE